MCVQAYYRQRVLLPMPLACRAVEPGDQRPPVERDDDIMPAWLRVTAALDIVFI